MPRREIQRDGPWYNPRRHGDLRKYIEKRRGGSSLWPLFLGYKWLHLLWDLGYTDSDMNNVRVCYLSMRGDEHYVVKGRNELAGIDAGAFSGRAGTHKPRDVIPKDVPYEVYDMNPKGAPHASKGKIEILLRELGCK